MILTVLDSLLCGLSRVGTGALTCRRHGEATEGLNAAQAVKATSYEGIILLLNSNVLSHLCQAL